ncbi:type IV toxin-antitoxin system AbiEi family antitoxin domain-containing protein [Tessaracoccus oleiagri]|uniref:Transcriptional regulator, AbiEi antitoxin, Type IV TA system n=1 Tax=Tessaracoccus oleiagri TaxID=686624 RepID=A0A1G9KMM0_9ACTN|nr:type IV toxin-antitoxin system AbiEi family antitoxin domain-containing protein [Tessaracoccus oleiagri]SDL50899.1 Transcriptional regulator, AbiEi antitoxin, Type IV TA system [Tessaracoccus oleiagri]
MTITYAELMQVGLTPAAVASLEKDDLLHRLRRGVYAHETSTERLAAHRALVEATRRVVSPTNVLSHTTAAALQGLPVRNHTLERVTMTRTTTGHADKGPHLRVRNTRLTDDEVTTLDGMPITTLARTVSDVARTEPLMWGVAAADRALADGLQRESLAAAVGMHPRLHGIRKALSVAMMASPFAESPAESLSRTNLILAGLPAPQEQVEIFDEEGAFVARVDFLWPDHGVVGEVDGAAKYGDLLEDGMTSQDAVMAEKHREAGLRRLGYWVTRWGWREAGRPGSLEALVGPALTASIGAVMAGFTQAPESRQRSL